jgi:hypothetical protein
MQKAFGDKTIDFSKIPNITDDDVAFLSDIFVRYPRVLEGYHKFTNTPPHERIALAMDVLDKQPRTGWKIRFDEIPDDMRSVLELFANEYYGPKCILMTEKRVRPEIETVLEHSAEAQELFLLVYAESVSRNHSQWGMECMKFHDFHEAIDGDFAPGQIPRQDKKRLEHISTELLCEARYSGNLHTMHVYNCCKLFEGHISDPKAMREEMLAEIRTQRAEEKIKPGQMPGVQFFDEHYTKSIPFPDPKTLQQQCADMDALHMLIRTCRMKKEKHVNPENLHKLEEFWTYVSPKLQTPQANAFYKAFEGAYLDENAPYQYSLIWAAEAANFPRR